MDQKKSNAHVSKVLVTFKNPDLLSFSQSQTVRGNHITRSHNWKLEWQMPTWCWAICIEGMT